MRWVGIIVCILALAFTLRVSKLAEQAIWWDEAWSILLAERALDDITRTIAFDAHPPLYQWLMHGWIRLTGISEFAARYLSVLAGVLTVAVCIALAQRLTRSRHAALVAGLVTAISVIGIDWSQEARMYATGGLCAALVVYVYVRLADHPSRRMAVVMAVVAISAPLTQYLAGVAVLIVNLHALLTQRSRRLWVHWIPAMCVAGAVVGGWILYSLTLATRNPRQTDNDLTYPIQLWAATLVNGGSANIEQFSVPSFILFVFVVCGLGIGVVRRRRETLLAALLIGLPPFFVWAVNFVLVLPLADRYYALMTPLGLVAVIAALYSLAKLHRSARALVAVLGITMGLFGLTAVWRDWDARTLRDDYATLIRAVDLLADEGDTIMFISGERYPLVEYPLRKLYYPSPTPYRISRVPSGDDWEQLLPNTTRNMDRVWLIFIERTLGDRDGAREAWLRANYRVEMETSIGHNGFALLTRREDPTYPEMDVVLPPAVRNVRPFESLRVGVPGGQTATLTRHGDVIQQATPQRWHVVTFELFPAYANGDYLLTVADKSFQIRMTHGQPEYPTTSTPLADFGALNLQTTEVQAVPGQPIQVRLLWHMHSVSAQNLNVFVHVVGPWNNAANSPLWAQSDGLPVETPLWAWTQGMTAAETHHLMLPAALPAGEYVLRVGLYNWTTGQRVLLPSGEDAWEQLLFTIP